VIVVPGLSRTWPALAALVELSARGYAALLTLLGPGMRTILLSVGALILPERCQQAQLPKSRVSAHIGNVTCGSGAHSGRL